MQRRLSEMQQESSDLQQQLTSSNSAHDRATTELKKEQGTSQRLQQECNELKQTCAGFKGEVNSLLADLQEQGTTITTLEEERDALRDQVVMELRIVPLSPRYIVALCFSRAV